jgi:hypothetical protein
MSWIRWRRRVILFEEVEEIKTIVLIGMSSYYRRPTREQGGTTDRDPIRARLETTDPTFNGIARALALHVQCLFW